MFKKIMPVLLIIFMIITVNMPVKAVENNTRLEKNDNSNSMNDDAFSNEEKKSKTDNNNNNDELEKNFYKENSNFFQEGINDDAKEFFDDNDISLDDPEGVNKLTITGVISYIFSTSIKTIKHPFRLLGLIMSITLIISIVSNLSAERSTSSSLNRVIDIVGVLVCIIIIYPYISTSIEITAKTLNEGANFMKCFVPIFAGIIGASGSITTAGIYNVGVLMVAEIAVLIATSFLLPLMGIFLSVSIIEAINPALNLSSITQSIKKFIQWCLGIIMTIFVGMISIQSIVSTSADSLSIRTGKFMASSFIPVIGGAISDAYTTVRGSLGILRSGVGTLGIIILFLTILPPILYVTVIKLSISFGSFIADILNAGKVALLLKNLSSVLSIAISLLVYFALMLIISTAIIMMVGLNM